MAITRAQNTEIDQATARVQCLASRRPSKARMAEGSIAALANLLRMMIPVIHETRMDFTNRLVLGPKVLRVAEHLDVMIMLQLLDRFLCPIRAREGHVGVDPRNIFPITGKALDRKVEHVFFAPEFEVAPHLNRLGVARFGDFEITVSKSHFSGVKLYPTCLHMSFEFPVEIVAGTIPNGVGNTSYDIEVTVGHADI